MPLVLLAIIALGLGFGGSFFSKYEIEKYEASHVREMSCEEFYKNPVSDGYIKLTDCKIYRLNAYFFSNSKTGQVAYACCPVSPENKKVDKFRIVVKEGPESAQTLQELLRPIKGASEEKALAYIGEHRAEFMHRGTIEGALIFPKVVVDTIRRDGKEDFESDCAIIDPNDKPGVDSSLDLSLAFVLFAISGIGTGLGWNMYVGPRLRKDPRGIEDRNGFIGLAGFSADELRAELDHGAKFVVYSYCVSIIFMTFKRSSPIYFITSKENRVLKGLPYAFTSFCAGWWGFPWGPIYTLQSLFICLKGGEDVTQKVVSALQPRQSEVEFE